MGGYSIFAGTLADMAWPQVEAAASRNAPLLVPVAVIEQHSLHLPLATDTYGAYLLCSLIQKDLAERDLEVLIAPPYYFGVNATTAMFPGSIHIRPELVRDMLVEILQNYARWGLRRQFIVNHHGDPQHNRAIVEAIQALRAQGVETTYFLGGMIQAFVDAAWLGTFGRPLPLNGDEVLRSPESEATKTAISRLTQSQALDVHAGERETSLIMRWFPETLAEDVDLDGLRAVPDSIRDFQEAERTGKWRELSPEGHIGDPARATSENGEIYAYEAADMAAALAAFLTRSGLPGPEG